MNQLDISEQLKEKYGSEHVIEQETADGILTVWILREDLFDCIN